MYLSCRCYVPVNRYGDLYEESNPHMKRLTGIPFRSVSDKVLENSSRIARFPIDSVRPEESAKEIHQPVLIAHGTADNYITIEYGKRIFRNLASAQKEWYPVEGGDHNAMLRVAGVAYERKVVEFFKSNLRGDM